MTSEVQGKESIKDMNGNRIRGKHTALAALPILLLVMGFLAASGASVARADPGLDPSSVTATITPGSPLTIQKTVHTPTIPPKPDIIFLADTTGSMGTAIGSVQGSIAPIMTTVLGTASDAQFGAAQYKDFTSEDGGFCGPEPAPGAFNLDQAITATTADVTTAAGTWSANGGCDIPEAQLNALSVLSGVATGWRSGSTRIIVWFGDATGHDPSNGVSLAAAITALTGPPVIKVIAVDVGALNAFPNESSLTIGQATSITVATGGVLLSGVSPSATAAAILTGLTSLPVTVSMTSDCSSPITTSFSPASQTVTSGTDAVFSETISVAAGATPGVYQCDDWALIDGKPMTDAAGNIIKEHKTITVPDRMTGGGSVFTSANVRVTHGFELHCDTTRFPNNLEVNWGKGNKFHLDTLTFGNCTDDLAITPNPPAAGFDTYTGKGTGTYNGVAGATAEWTFTDAGEPGKNDTAKIVIKDVTNTVVLTVTGKLQSGNQQAH